MHFSELVLVRHQAAIYYFGEMLYIVQLSGKTLFRFGCHILRKKKEFFPSANCEHLNGIVLDFASGMLAGGKEQKEQPSGFT